MNSRVVFRLDVNRPRLTGIGAAVEIGARDDVRVIETEAGRAWYERDPAHLVRGNKGRALLRRTINLARHSLPMPMHKLGRVGVIEQVDHHALALLEAQ